MTYKHTQVGYLIIITLIIPLLILFFTIIFIDLNWALLITFLILLLSSGLFSFLTVEVNKTKLIVKFSFGIINKKFNLRDIRSCGVVKNHWYYGWGIRLWLWPYMWIYNVSGFGAVEIKTKNDKTYRIGTDEPENLKQAIMKSIKQI